jgi:hypothetical protein
MLLYANDEECHLCEGLVKEILAGRILTLHRHEAQRAKAGKGFMFCWKKCRKLRTAGIISYERSSGSWQA